MSFISSLFSPIGQIKRWTEWDDNIISIPEPDYVVIPLEYPGKVLYKPLISIGERVSKNQILGKSALGHCVHSSISGEVKDILLVWTAQMYHVPAVLIQRNDSEPLSLTEVFEQYGVPFEEASTNDKLKALGVVSPWTRPGRFYQEAKEDFPEIQKIVIQAIDEEPTVFVNDLILKNFADKLKRGIKQVSSLSPRAEIILTVSDYLESLAKDKFGDQVKVFGISSNYRDRIERVVIPRVTGVEIPYNMAFRSRGIARINAEYLLNMVDALEGKSPFSNKMVTISGSGLDKPITVEFPIGTNLRHILSSVNLNRSDFRRIISGGPMRGYTQYTDLTPITKTANGLYLQKSEEIPPDSNHTCGNCGRCTRVCPANLQVHLIGRYAEFDMLLDVKQFHPEICIECGLCGYVCPAHRPILQLIQMCKKYYGYSHEASQQQIECSDQSSLERWVLNLQNTKTVADSIAAGNNR